jgi:repressor LexA
MGVNSRAGIARIVHDLESQGLLTRRRENGHFYIDVGKRPGQFDTSGGLLIEWLETPICSLPPFTLPEFMLAGYEPSAIRAFRVPDNALADEDICENDVALIELREFARDGQVVVAILDDTDTMLRKYFRDGAYIELRSSIEIEESIRLSADRVEIKGVYRGLLRPLV